MKQVIIVVAALMLAVTATALGSEAAPQSRLTPEKAAAAAAYPKIVLYSVAWCPHCREAKQYLTRNDIPFINRDVEVDVKAMDDLTVRYNSTGVPLIVFGSGTDEIVMRGFSAEFFQENLKKARQAK